MAPDPVRGEGGRSALVAEGGASTVGEAAGWSVYGDAFDPGFGNSAAFELDESGRTVLAELRDGHVTPSPPAGAVPLCFIDGRRRVELGLWAEQAGTGRRVAGLAGAYAVGAVTIPPGRPARFAGVRVGRVAIWGGGRAGDLVAPGGYHWVSASTTAEDPAVILANLQERMRRAEGNLALDAARCGWNVVLDGPLNRIRSLHELVTGYVKSHSSRVLPDDADAAVPRLAVGARTAVYAVGEDRYTCYIRVGAARRAESPWTGIARLQFPAVAGLAAVVARADLLASVLPRYAGARHRDPRAPVNLTPVKNLEEHLSRMLGPVELATRPAGGAGAEVAMTSVEGTTDLRPAGDAAGLEPGERELVALTTPDDVTGEDRRNDLSGLEGVPATEPVGLVDASVDASTQVAQVLIDGRVDLALDTFVVTPQRLVDGSVLFHYGIVTEVAGRVEGAATATDTARLANATLPGQRFRRAEVTWTRTHPELYLPPSSGAPVWVAAGEHRRRALFLDKMDLGEEVPIGLDMNDEVVFIPYSFLNGERGAHASISGKSGVATKTSYALFLLYVLFETDWGLRARAANPHDRALLFSVKGSDLCLLDRHSNVFVDTNPTGVLARQQWRALGVDDPEPFSSVAVYAPAEDAPPGSDPVADISVRDKQATEPYGWSPLAMIRAGLLEYVFDDLESGQLSFIEQVVRTELLRWAYPHVGDTTGKVVLAPPPSTLGRSWEAASRGFRTKKPLGPLDGEVVETLDGLVEFIASKVTDSDPAYDPAWTGNVTAATTQAFVRRLWKATPRLRRLVRAGLAEVDLARQVSVVDVHALHADAQRFVVAAVLARVWSEHEDSTAAGRTFVVLDELNKYAPRAQSSPIKALLVDIAARGRSLGVILIGAQQNPSGVDRDITNNAALEAVGQIKASEASELGFLPPDMRARAQIIAPGTMITSQPLLPAPVPIRFPFPPYATRYSEVLVSADDDARGRSLLEDM